MKKVLQHFALCLPSLVERKLRFAQSSVDVIVRTNSPGEEGLTRVKVRRMLLHEFLEMPSAPPAGQALDKGSKQFGYLRERLGHEGATVQFLPFNRTPQGLGIHSSDL
jgi:hypothetical protein